MKDKMTKRVSRIGEAFVYFSEEMKTQLPEKITNQALSVNSYLHKVRV